MGQLSHWKRLAQAGMRQDAIIGDVEYRQLMLHAVVALAQGVDPTPDRCHTLAHVKIAPLHKGRIDRPATRRQDVLDRLSRAQHHPVLHPDHTPTPVLLDDLRIEQARPRQPAWLGPRAFVVATLGGHPQTDVAHYSGQLALEPVA